METKWLTTNKKSGSGILYIKYYDYKLKKDVPSYFVLINGAEYTNIAVKLFTEKDFIDYLEYRFSISIRTMREPEHDGNDRNTLNPYAIYIDDKRSLVIEQNMLGLDLTVGIVNEDITNNPKKELKTKMDGLINLDEIMNSFFNELVTNRFQRQIITDNILDRYKNHGYFAPFLISEISLEEYKDSFENLESLEFIKSICEDDGNPKDDHISLEILEWMTEGNAPDKFYQKETEHISKCEKCSKNLNEYKEIALKRGINIEKC